MPCYAIEGVIPVVDPQAYVHPSAVLVGDVVVGPGCYVGPLASLRGDLGRVEMKAGSNVQDGCVLHGFPQASTVVEEDGHIGHGAVLHGCIVRRGAMVGMNAVVMDEAEVGARAIVAACALVPAGMSVPAGWLAAGLPAKNVRALTGDEMARKAEGTAIYQHLAQRCRVSMREVAPLPSLDDPRPRLGLLPKADRPPRRGS